MIFNWVLPVLFGSTILIWMGADWRVALLISLLITTLGKNI